VNKLDNIILNSDSYKVTHWKQYPEKTEEVYSYFESRGGLFKQTVFFGLQYQLKKHILGQVVTKEKIDEAREISSKHFGSDKMFNNEGWLHILKQHKGVLPVRIKAVPEGCVVPVSNVLMTVENTDKNVPWLTNYLESILAQNWYPTTVATLSREIKKLIFQYLVATGTPESVDFKLHDFGLRGATSVESSAIGGLAHLINFKGTDTLPALKLAKDYYGFEKEVAGFSVPASEHSTITSWGRYCESVAYKNMLEQYKDMPIVACVSDSYNIYDACELLWGELLKEDILAMKGTLVIRPDSGDPVTVILKVLEILGRKFGYEINAKGYRVLNSKVRVIQGDGVDYDSIQNILEYMRQAEWSADNISFGMGGALLQKVNRDTQKFAFKCSNIIIDGVSQEVYKDPITDKGKTSKKGKLKLALLGTKDGALFETVSDKETKNFNSFNDVLKEVCLDGKLIKEYNLDEIRKNSLKDSMFWDLPNID
jgi:nicotinamide phosphoribosyltransferase